MKFRSIASVRRRDALTIEGGTAGYLLMRRAGGALARITAQLLRERSSNYCLLVAGYGNNGGDAFVAARLLSQWGVICRVVMIAPPDKLRGDALTAYEDYLQAISQHHQPEVLATADLWNFPAEILTLPPGAVVVDALLGTGAAGAPRGIARTAIRWLQRVSRIAAIVAVDIPSGLDGDSGLPHDQEDDPAVVTADITVTFDSPKIGFLAPHSWRYLGRVEVIDIGLDVADEPVSDAPLPIEMIATGEMRALLPRRRRASHKGDYGRILVVGGSQGMAGAPYLAALGALRAGAGLVTAAVPKGTETTLMSLLPEAMTVPLAATNGGLTWRVLAEWRDDLGSFDTIVAGPGLGSGIRVAELIKGLLQSGCKRIVLDADALNSLTLLRPLPPAPHDTELIITPHPGEAARLLGIATDAVQTDRLTAADKLVEATRAVVVLKGAGTLVAAEGRRAISLGGNPGMATGGSGDVLAGIIGALWARGVDGYDAARLGVYLHAAAGDRLAWRLGEEALLASDIALQNPILDTIPLDFHQS